jgi:hypothetical protein
MSDNTCISFVTEGTITHITSGTRTTFYSAIEFAENNCCIKLTWILVLVIRGYHKKK